jgi:hypothetical protein
MDRMRSLAGQTKKKNQVHSSDVAIGLAAQHALSTAPPSSASPVFSKKFQNEKKIFDNSHLVVSEIMANFRSQLFPDKFTVLLRIVIFAMFASAFIILGNLNAFSSDRFYELMDVNECSTGGLCDFEGVRCKNLIFAGRECFCDPGRRAVVDARSASVTACLLIDECGIGSHNCDSTSKCIDLDNGFICMCPTTSVFPSDSACSCPSGFFVCQSRRVQ